MGRRRLRRARARSSAGMYTKSHCRNGRSWPSMTRSASPEITKNASASVSQWYCELGSPGSRTASWTPSIGKNVSASHSFRPVNDTLRRPGRSYHRASRALRTNQPGPTPLSPCSVCSGGLSGISTGGMLRGLREPADPDRGHVGRHGRIRSRPLLEPAVELRRAAHRHGRAEDDRERRGLRFARVRPRSGTCPSRWPCRPCPRTRAASCRFRSRSPEPRSGTGRAAAPRASRSASPSRESCR